MWSEIRGHDRLIEQFRERVGRGRLASTFLFVGPPGVGKRTFSIKLAQALLCDNRTAGELDPCGTCDSCQQVMAGTHPDMEMVAKPQDKNFIPIELFVGDREHRMQEGLCHNIALKPYRGGHKIAIIDDADYLNQEGANCLLKTLEEPPPGAVLILIGTSEQKQLPTIRSRSQVVRFSPLETETVRELLLASRSVETEQEAETLAGLSCGSLEEALQLADPAVREMRANLLELLSAPNSTAWDARADVASFVDAAGKDPSARRRRLGQTIRLALQFYRQLMRGASGGELLGEQQLAAAVRRAQAHAGNPAVAAACVQRCLDALTQLEANANQATLMECWLNDLAKLHDAVSIT